MLGGKSRVAGRISTVGWALGLVTGVIAFANGYLLVAAAGLLLAVLAPLLGLAAVLHSKPRVFDSELPCQAQGSVHPLPLSGGGYRIRLPAR